MQAIEIDAISLEMQKMLQEYADLTSDATEKALDVGAKVLIRNLKANSPKDKGEFANSWKAKPKYYKLTRYVGNTKIVKGRSEEEIPLSNILEYSTTHAKPFIKRTYDNSVDQIASAIVNEIKKGI